MTTPHVPRSTSLLVAALGVVGLGGNVAAVALLQGSPHAYKAESLGPWLGELLKTRAETEYAAVAFTVGLVALAAFFLELAALAPSPTAALGARLAALGATGPGVGRVSYLGMASLLLNAARRTLAAKLRLGPRYTL